MNETALVQQNQALSIREMRNQVNLIQKAMEEVMQDGIHYGTIPGCGPKPTLMKPGAEKICMLFRLAPEFEVMEQSVNTPDHIKYVVRCRMIGIQTGLMNGSGIGTCSSAERKYAKQEPADIENTICKMAQKRALVGAVLVATAASDIYNQDIEEAATGSGKRGPKQVETKKRASKAAAAQVETNKPVPAPDHKDGGIGPDYAQEIVKCSTMGELAAVGQLIDADDSMNDVKRTALFALGDTKKADLEGTQGEQNDFLDS